MRSKSTAGANTAKGSCARAGLLAVAALAACVVTACGGGTSMGGDPDARPFDPGDVRGRDAVAESAPGDVATAYDGPSVDVIPLDVSAPDEDATMGVPADAGASDAAFPSADAAPSFDSGPTPDAPSIDAGRGDVASTRDASFDAIGAADAGASDVIALRDVMPSSRCVEIAEAYAQLVVEAQTCSRGTQCAYPMCETLCCSCRVLVNPSALDQRRALALQAEWMLLRCSEQLACTAARCEAPVRGDCSSAGRCVTIRSGG